MSDKIATSIEAIADALNTKKTIDDFVAAFATVMEIIVTMKADNEEERSVIQAHLKTALQKLNALKEELKTNNLSEVNSIKGDVETRLNNALTTFAAEISRLITDQQTGMAFIYDKVASLRDGRDGRDGTHADRTTIIREITEQVLPTIPKEVDLSPLQNDIKDLQEEIRKLRKRPGGTNFVISRGAVVSYDISASLDGVTKTFSLPAFKQVLLVLSSSTPVPLRKTTDWTTDAAAMTITFTSNVDETTVLAQPQTLLILYAEN